MRNEFDRDRLTDFLSVKDHIVSEVEVFNFLDDLAETGKIDPELWHNKRIIASGDFMESLSEAYRQRKGDQPTLSIVRIEYDELPDFDYKPRVCDNNGNIPVTSHDNSGNIPNKEEKIREDKIKEDKINNSAQKSEIDPEIEPEPEKTPAAEAEPQVQEPGIIEFKPKSPARKKNKGNQFTRFTSRYRNLSCRRTAECSQTTARRVRRSMDSFRRLKSDLGRIREDSFSG